MKKPLTIAGALLSVAMLSLAQSPMLQEMATKSSDILAVTCETVSGGKTDEQGVEEWTATCRTDLVIKGKLAEGKKILIHFNRFTFGKKPESPRFSKDGRYLVFLDGLAGAGTAAPGADPLPVYRLLDRWLSVQPFDWHLVRELKPDVKKDE